MNRTLLPLVNLGMCANLGSRTNNRSARAAFWRRRDYGKTGMMRFFSILVLAAGMAACGSPAEQKLAPTAESSGAPAEISIPANSSGVETIAVARKSVPDYLEIAGRVQPDPTKVIRVYPPLGGRVMSVDVRPGDHVRRGQQIATLDSGDVAAARADFQKARADSELKARALVRAADLYQHQAIAEKDYQQAVADDQSAKSELDRARTQLKVLGVSPDGAMDRLSVTAPRDAVVLDIGAAPGEFSKSLDAPAPLCTLADLSTVWVMGDVYEKDIVGVKAGDRAEIAVSAYPGQKLEGRVGNVGDAIDPLTHALRLRVVLPNPGERLKPEMFASIRVLRATVDGIQVPTSALLREPGGVFIFVQKSPGHFEKRGVKPGRAVGSEIEITEGLQAGETVVTEGALLVRAAS
jgi:membrane fusion protein, heavy metal efflux system